MSDEVIKKSDLKYFELAKELAAASDFNVFKIGCVLVYHGKVLAVGQNTTKTSPTQKKYNRYRKFNKGGNKPIQHSNHAEITAIRSISYAVDKNVDWKRVKVYLYRIASGLPLGMGCAKPCAACMNMLRDKGIKHIYYSDTDGYCYQRLE